MQVNMSILETITRLAAQYGPFLFAMLFIFVVTRTAHNYYRESNTRQPQASEEEKRTYRSYFVTSVWVGISLALLSIGWWIYVQMEGPSVYQIAIVGLHSDESILSQYFSKIVPRPTIAGANPLADEYFIVAQDRPFRMGDKFEFYYFKTLTTNTVTGGANATAGVGVIGVPIEIKYSGNNLDTYQITQTGNLVSLTLVASNPSTINGAFAENEVKRLQPGPESVADASVDGRRP
ncbi:MAG: hypothetical protein WA268_23930 [Xanthobacteraceae bacterium]